MLLLQGVTVVVSFAAGLLNTQRYIRDKKNNK